MMNERIKELAEQAGYYIAFDPDGTLVRTSTPGADGNLSLFAELIVQDCLAQIDRAEAGLADNKEKIGAVYAGYAVAKHFGVE